MVKWPVALICLISLMGCGAADNGSGGAVKQANMYCNSMNTIVFYPKDIEASKRFYTENLGFKVDYPFSKVVASGYKLSNGPVEVVLVNVFGKKPSTIERFQINLQINDLDAVYNDLTMKDVEIVLRPEKTDWGSRWFQIKDPDGLIIGLEEILKKDENK